MHIFAHPRFSFLCVGAIAAFALQAGLVSSPLRAQDAEAATEKEVFKPSPDGKFAFLATTEPVKEPQKAFDLIEKDSQKVLFRISQSEDRFNRLGLEVLWSPDSKFVALGTIYNHFGAGLSVYRRTGDTFREIKLPDTSVPEISDRLLVGHEWKTTGINDHNAQRWQKDGSLIVHVQSTLQAINSNLTMVSERTVVLGFSKTGKAKILQSKQKVHRHIEED